ncbi:MAG: glycine cleavage system protein H [Acidobacteria bacterium]|nr:glycine cleavage system protein H [Acidobacteriota bacterium]
MVVLLVLLTFAVFITIDYLLNREKYAFPVAEELQEATSKVPVPVVAGVVLPEHLHYHPGHTWAAQEGSHRLRVGIDEFAARLLGRLTKVEAPQRGRWFGQGDRGWTLHAGDRQASVPMPVEGEVIEVNEEALAHPEKVTADPYGEGWLFVVRSADPVVSLRNLLDGTLARRWMEETVAELRRRISPLAPATAPDGGLLLSGIASQLDAGQWEDLTHRFFRL